MADVAALPLAKTGAHAVPSGPPVGNPYLDTLIGHTKWGWDSGQPHVLNYYFDETSDGAVPWGAAEKTAFRQSLNAFEAVADLKFVEVSNASDANLVEKMQESLSDGAAGRHFFPSGTQTRGEYSLGYFYSNFNSLSLIQHELGHGLGLYHPHSYWNAPFPGVTGPYDRGDNGLNFDLYTQMTYVSSLLLRPITPMAFDIASLQVMYGANKTTNLGAATYLLQGESNVASCIWDNGGSDTIRYDGSNRARISLIAATIDNSPTGGGDLSCVYGTDDEYIGNAFTIAKGVKIENAAGGGGADTLIGNKFTNTLEGNDGDDLIDGGGGSDILRGASGKDTLNGGEGNDFAYGGEGDDDQYGGHGDDLLSGDDGDDHIDGGVGHDRLLGGKGRDTLVGDADDDTLFGNNGDDCLAGGSGMDRAVYSMDRKFFVIDQIGEQQIVVRGVRSGVEHGADTLIGIETIEFRDQTIAFSDLFKNAIFGSDNDDMLSSAAGKTVVLGGRGNDTMVGSAADDFLSGGDGDDLLTTSVGNDVMKGGGGKDAIDYSTSFTGAPNGKGVQINLGGTGYTLGSTTLQALSAVKRSGVDTLLDVEFVTGTLARDTIIGSAADETLAGGAGNDYLASGGGDDSLAGGSGDDTFVANQTSKFDGNSGFDQLQLMHGSSQYYVFQNGARKVFVNWNVSEIVADNIEQFVFDGVAVDLASLMQGVNGTSSNDRYAGSERADAFVGSDGSDLMTGLGGEDLVDYSRIAINGATGVKVNLGEAFSKDGVVLQAHTGVKSSGGVDTIYDVEKILGTSGRDTIAGSSKAETLAGGKADDLLFGCGGDDSIIGGDGDDIIFVGSGAAAIDGSDGIDTIDYSSLPIASAETAGVAVNLGVHRYNAGGLVIPADCVIKTSGVDAIRNIEAVKGTSGQDTLVGSTGADTISGGGGSDLIRSLGGADSISGGTGNDSIFAESGTLILDGGDGSDLIDYSALTLKYADQGVRINLRTAAHQFSEDVIFEGQTAIKPSGADALFNFEDVRGSQGNDTIVGVAGSQLFGGGGDDLLIAGTSGTLIGGDGIDEVIYAGLITDYYQASLGEQGGALIYKDGSRFLNIGFEYYLFDGFTGVDSLSSLKSSFIGSGSGTSEDDLYLGDAESNAFFGSAGMDILLGNGGTDLVDYSRLNGAGLLGVQVNLDSATYVSGALSLQARTAVKISGGTDSVSDFEQVRGTSGGDTIVGSSANETLFGNGGDDLLMGGGGDDQLLVTNGAATIDGGAGADVLAISGSADSYFKFKNTDASYVLVSLDGSRIAVKNVESFIFNGVVTDINSLKKVVSASGTAGDDFYLGAQGNDTLQSSGGNDTIDGRGGVDLLSYVSVNGWVNADLATGIVQKHDSKNNLMGHDAVMNIERFSGTLGNDIIKGGNRDDVFIFSKGADVIDGGDGVDTLELRYALANVQIERDTASGGFNVTTADGTSRVNNIESFKFLSGAVRPATDFMF